MITGEDTLEHTLERLRTFTAVRENVADRLRARLPEIERAIFAGLRAGTPDPATAGDAEYVQGLRVTIVAVLDYALAGIAMGEDGCVTIPSAAIAQARRAACNDVGLETVLLRYAIGNRVLSDFVMEEIDHLPGRRLREVLGTQGALVERLMGAVSSEYKLERERMGRSSEQRRGERVQRLLAGESPAAVEFGYELEGAWHLGIIAVGARVREATRGLGVAVGRDMLALARGEATAWLWLGGERPLAIGALEPHLAPMVQMGVSVAVGEPSSGVGGWRLTHRQAQAALLVALHRPQGVTRYADDMLLAAALQDETLATSLREIYMSPLSSQRDGGVVLRETLRGYFDVTCNAATAAVKLKVDRHTVERRLHKIEERLGRLLPACQTELEVALRLHDLGVGG